MYNFKEKKLHFNALRNPDAAAFDLELLQKISPIHPNLRTFSRDPKRYCDDILYALLDLTSREEIRTFRRAKHEETLQVAQEQVPGSGSDNPLPAKDKVTDTPSDTTIEKKAEGTNIGTETATTDVTPATNGVEDNIQSIEESASEVNSAAQIEELKQSLEETEERANGAESALKEEKKKEKPEPIVTPVKSKSTKNIRKSTGTTSSTRKSK